MVHIVKQCVRSQEISTAKGKKEMYLWFSFIQMVITILLVQYSISLCQSKPFQGVEHFCKEPFENFVTALSRQILRGTSRHNNLTNFCHRFLGSPENDSTGAGHFRIVTRVFLPSLVWLGILSYFVEKVVFKAEKLSLRIPDPPLSKN